MRFRLAPGLLLAAGVILHFPAPRATAQALDPAVVAERLQRLSAMVEAVELSQASQKRQLDTLGNVVHKLREETANASREAGALNSRRPWAEDVKRASEDVRRHSEDLKRLAEAIDQVDRKRAADHEQVLKILADLRKAINSAAETPAPRGPGRGSGATENRSDDPGSPSARARRDKEPEPEAGPEKYVEHVVQPGQTLSLIVSGFNTSARKQGYKTLTPDQVAKFNKVSDASKIREGMKLKLPLIPAPVKTP